jgi:hypothetical protein
MSISQKSLRSESGFESPGFKVDTYGNVNIAGAFKINGVSISSSSGTLSSMYVYSSLTRVGTLSQLTVNGPTVLSGGTLTVSSTGIISITSGTTGSLNNVIIGNNTAAAGTFTNLTANISTITSLTAPTLSTTSLTATNLTNTGTLNINPTTLGAINHVNIGYNTPGTGKFTKLTLTTDPSNTTDATTKKYVDTRATAMAIALGS